MGEAVEAHVASCNGPFVVLFSKEGTDETDDGSSGWEDANDVGASPDFFVQTFGSSGISVGGFHVCSWGRLSSMGPQVSRTRASAAWGEWNP